MEMRAVFDETSNYRYVLSRKWSEGEKFVNFIMLNPSRADDKKDDPTIRRCISFAKKLGFDGLYVTNLFAFRTFSPKILKSILDPVGKENDKYVLEYAKKSNMILLSWGNHGIFKSRNKEILNLLKDFNLFSFGVSKMGEPKHPLYLRSDSLPAIFNS